MITLNNKNSFGNIVDAVYNLSLEERLELKDLLESNIAESKRTEFLRNGKEAKALEKSGKLEFSDNIDTLKRTLL